LLSLLFILSAFAWWYLELVIFAMKSRHFLPAIYLLLHIPGWLIGYSDKPDRPSVHNVDRGSASYIKVSGQLNRKSVHIKHASAIGG